MINGNILGGCFRSRGSGWGPRTSPHRKPANLASPGFPLASLLAHFDHEAGVTTRKEYPLLEGPLSDQMSAVATRSLFPEWPAKPRVHGGHHDMRKLSGSGLSQTTCRLSPCSSGPADVARDPADTGSRRPSPKGCPIPVVMRTREPRRWDQPYLSKRGVRWPRTPDMVHRRRTTPPGSMPVS